MRAICDIFGLWAVVVLFLGVACEGLGGLFGVPALRAIAAIAALVFALQLPVRLVLRRPETLHPAHPYILAMAALLAMAMPASTYRECGLLMAGNEPVTSYWDCLYFASVTWTTVGFGDLHPVGWGKLIAASHAMLGYIYMALLIGFIAEHIRNKRASKP